MERYKLSVIIPIYNTEKYIERCVRSLFTQTMLDGVEFIFIDDKTPDNSIYVLESVIEEYPLLQNQIRIMHNETNLGILPTRKRGVKEAQGEYIAWVDSDDWIEPECFYSLYQATNDGVIDIVVQNLSVHHFYDGKEHLYEWKLYPESTPQAALSKFWTERHVPRGLHFQLSRRKLIAEAMERVYSVNVFEDTFALLYLFSQAKTAKWLQKAFYNYSIVDKSQSLSHRDYRTLQEWNRQRMNIDALSDLLLTGENRQNYLMTIRYIKLRWKYKFKSVFSNKKEYWSQYKDSYQSICTFLRISRTYQKILIWLSYNYYFLYKLRDHSY